MPPSFVQVQMESVQATGSCHVHTLTYMNMYVHIWPDTRCLPRLPEVCVRFTRRLGDALDSEVSMVTFIEKNGANGALGVHCARDVLAHSCMVPNWL